MTPRAANQHLNVVQIPILRGVGSLILCFYVLVYDMLIAPPFSLVRYFTFVGVFAAYCFGSWLILTAAYRRVRVVDLSLSFLVLDLFLWLFAIYRTGADQSLLFFVGVLHVSAQTHTTFRRVMLFVYLSLAAYASFLIYLVSIEGRLIDWRMEAVKITYIAGANIYLAFVMRPAEALREQRKNAALEAHRRNRQLVRNSRDLEEARLKAEAMNQAKGEFLAHVSHEIRTPMNAIVGMTELAVSSESNSEQRRYLETVKRSADLLLQIIDDILDFSKIEAGKLELHPAPFSLRDTLSDTFEVLAGRAVKKDIEMACQVSTRLPDCLYGDSVRLRQILINLIGNSIKFTDEGEVFVSVDLESVESSDDSTIFNLHFIVTDTGIGIPADKQKTIFESFVQGDRSMTRRYGGTGLGLAICSQLVEMMNGRIWVESEVGRGSAFHFIVQMRPERRANMMEAPPKPMLDRAARSLRILLAEDNEINQQVAVEFLRRRGHQVRIAGNGIEALARLASEHFDVVLMDLQMPEMDGLTATAAIREKEKTTGEHTPIIAMTGFAMREDRQHCLNAGMDAYISKPIRSLELYEVVESLTATRPSPRNALAPFLLD